MNIIDKTNLAKRYVTKDLIRDKFLEYHCAGMYGFLPMAKNLLNYTNTFMPTRIWVDMCNNEPDLADVIGRSGITVCSRLINRHLNDIIDEMKVWPV